MHVLIMYSPHSPSEEHVRRLQAEEGITNITVARDETTVLKVAPDVDVILGHRYLRQCVSHAPNLKWVQSTTQGVDRLPCAELARRNVCLTRYTGSSPIVARHAVALAWAVTRRIPTASSQQVHRRWNKHMEWIPHPERAIVFGTGNVGREIARLLRAHDIWVAGVRRTAKDGLPEFDELYGQDSWRGALSRSDWCFLALPYTPSTENMIDEPALQALPSHGVVVNVGRGETLELGPLTRLLRDGELGGAALDVLPAEMEPLAPSSELWSVPHLLLTPHVAAYHSNRRRAVERFCEQQMRRYLRGDSLKEVVELEGDPETSVHEASCHHVEK